MGDTGCLAIYECATAASCVADTTGACVTACINAQSASSQALYDNLGICDYEAECNGGSCTGTCNPTADYCSPTATNDAGTDANPSSDDAGTDSASAVDSSAPSDDAGQSTVDSAAPLTCDQCQKSACATQLTAVQYVRIGVLHLQPVCPRMRFRPVRVESCGIEPPRGC